MGYRRGRVREMKCFTREGKVWPLEGRFAIWHQLLATEVSREELELELRAHAEKFYPRDPRSQGQEVYQMKVALEALIADGWVKAALTKAQPALAAGRGARTIHDHAEVKRPIPTASSSRSELA